MRFGIIGYGRMGKTYHNILKTMNIDIGFICDVNNINNNIETISDYKEALNIPNIDGVIISTYGPSHYEILKYAINKKIQNIICEKPFTTSVKHADEIIKLIDKNNLRLTVNYVTRFSSDQSQ